MKICRIATVTFHLSTLFERQIHAIVQRGHDVVLIATPGPETENLVSNTGACFYPIAIERSLSLVADIKALLKLMFFLSKNKIDVIHSSTPKAGLLAAVAGCFCRVPVRIHSFTGQPWMELKGIMRWLAKMSDWLISILNTHCYADSASQRSFLLSQGIGKADSLTVILDGSVSGVDLSRFDPDRWSESQVMEIKEELGVSVDALVITFVGRVTKDKGIVELVTAFRSLIEQGMYAELLIVGPLEPDRDPLPSAVLSEMRQLQRIHMVGYTSVPEKYLAITDVFCLPSYREGFGTTVIEAAAMGIPTVGTAIIGLKDAVEDGVTGILVPPKDSNALARGLMNILLDIDLRQRFGRQARTRAQTKFDAIAVDQEVIAEYKRLMQL